MIHTVVCKGVGSMIRRIFLLLLVSHAAVAWAADDERLQVYLRASDYGVEASWLHTHIRKAAAMALPVVWQRIVPADQRAQLGSTPAIQFLQTAKPTEDGIIITFQQPRVYQYLKSHHIRGFDDAPSVSASANTIPTAPSGGATLLLTINHPASLPEQILFERDLSRDARIQSVTLYRLGRAQRTYRLQLSSDDPAWLTTWFRQRGMTLTPSAEGWIAN